MKKEELEEIFTYAKLPKKKWKTMSLKDVIDLVLQNQRAFIIKELEDMRNGVKKQTSDYNQKKHGWIYQAGYDAGIDEAIKKIKENKLIPSQFLIKKNNYKKNKSEKIKYNIKGINIEYPGRLTKETKKLKKRLTIN